MNQRIRELAEQAKAFIIESEQAKIGEVSEVSFDKYSDLEKFADLIVRECANLIQKPGSYEETYLSIAATKIKRHFGVEE